MLHSAPKLKVLVLVLEMMNSDLEEREPCVWIPPDEVPLCLSENLRIIGVKWLAGNDDEVLERMMIDSRGLDEEVMEKLMMCPTASGTCDV